MKGSLGIAAMTSNALTAPADACAPDANRAGPTMPEHLARLLAIVQTLLRFGRHFAALLERPTARRGFWLFSAVLGTRKQAVMRASLHRGMLRAAALEALLLRRAATGRDVAPPLLPACAAHGGDANVPPCDESFHDQVARLTAERAQRDAPVDPDHLATPQAIEAEVLTRSIGRTIADISRDLGVVAMMCTDPFWDAMTGAIAGYHDGTAAECLDDTPLPREPLPQQRKPDCAPQRMHRGRRLCARQTPALTIPRRRAVPFSPDLAPARPRRNVTLHRGNRAAAPAATGPPPRAPTQLAA